MTVLMPSWYYEKKDLKKSPSILDGLDPDCESRYRREGARFIINVGTKMGLRYDTMATGVVYFHRFYMFHSFRTFPRFVTACCCLFLAGKVEETPKKCKDIIRVARTFLTDAQFAQFGEDPKEEVMTLERILLQTIKFDLQVDHPYGYLLKYAKCLKGDKAKLQKMVQMAWTFINDSLCTTLSLQWEPEIIAIALMYLAGKLSKFEVIDWTGRTSRHSNWWDMYVEGMSIELLEDICHQVLDLYSTPMLNTPGDSPPATPPTKSTRKSQPPSPVAITTTTPPQPVKPKEVPVGQPIPRLEPGEVKRKVAKPAHRKESSEAKVSRMTSSSSSQAKKHSSSKSSPPKSIDDSSDMISRSNSPATPLFSEDIRASTKQTTSQFIQALEATYRATSTTSIQPGQSFTQVIPVVYATVPETSTSQQILTPTATSAYPPVTQVISSQYATYNQQPAQYYAPPETEGQYYTPVQQPPQQPGIFPAPQMQATHSAPPPPPPPPPHTVPQPHQGHPPPPQYTDMYSSQTIPPPQPVSHPGQYPPPPVSSNVPPTNPQYPPPPPHPPMPTAVQNAPPPPPPPTVTIPAPPPPCPAVLPPPPAAHPLEPGVRPEMSHIPHAQGMAHPPVHSGPPVMTQNMPPPHHLLHDMSSAPPVMSTGHYAPRPESDTVPQHHDSRSNMIPPNQRPPGHVSIHGGRPNMGPDVMPSHGPMHMPRTEHSQEFGPRSHYEHDRSLSFRNRRDREYERNTPTNVDRSRDLRSYTDYEEDYGPCQGPPNQYGPEYDGGMPHPRPHSMGQCSPMPPRRYSLEHQAHRKLERAPPPAVMKNLSHQEVPTGIPPVRITGRF